MTADKRIMEEDQLVKIVDAVAEMLPEGLAAYVAVFDQDPAAGRGVDVGMGTHDLRPEHHAVVLRNLASSASAKAKKQREWRQVPEVPEGWWSGPTVRVDGIAKMMEER